MEEKTHTHTDGNGNALSHAHEDKNGSVFTHTHTDANGNVLTHTHAEKDGNVLTHTHADKDRSVLTHTHTDENGNVITHTHRMSGKHGHYHSPEEKKRQINRLAKAIGHLQHVRTMVENDADCADVLTQLSAVNAARRSLWKEIINEHMTHCIAHAIADGDLELVEEFQKAVQKFI